ncbi:hypothetical protein [Tahibacter harae]|uniref:Uncharacterized protein n=1 Tax=Tahibacter harae TaxID=2963937 RepID=A0ABT1QQV6_9GAMM|nr:hypothetical protein [Tahibacter harae]MCQ4164688.1 hypothetical protein [Tahibacter harae]
MTESHIHRLAAAIIWAEFAAQTFDKYKDACPPELRMAQLGAKFSLESLLLLRDELDSNSRTQLDNLLVQVRAGVEERMKEEAANQVPA